MARRTTVLVGAAALALLLLGAVPASGATTGAVTVTVEGRVQTSESGAGLTVARFSGVQRLAGLVESAAEGDGVLVAFESGDPREPFVVGMLWTSAESPPETIACGRVACALDGPVVGLGRVELAEFEPVTGARVSVRIVVRRASCERCP